MESSTILTKAVSDYVQRLTCSYPAIDSIWLVGSRANPSDRPPNDWDLIVFGTNEVLAGLSNDADRFETEDIDLLVVTDKDRFRSPWPRIGEGGGFKEGHLFPRESDGPHGGTELGWEWTQISAEKAAYRAGMYRGGGPQIALCVFDRGRT